MTIHATTPIPAGWYPDPQGSFQQRWWNGASWTNEFAQYRPTLNYSPQAKTASAAQAIPVYAPVAPSPLAPPAPRADLVAAAPLPVVQQPEPVETPIPVAVEQAPLRPTSPDQLLRVQAAGTATPEVPAPPTTVVPNPIFDALPSATPAAPARHVLSTEPVAAAPESYQPFGYSARSIARQAAAKPRRRYTVAAWVLSLVPLLAAGAAVAIAYYVPVLYTLFAVAIIGIVLLASMIGLGYADSARLRHYGFERTVPGIVGALGPIYFIARVFVAAKQSGRPGIWLLILSLLVWGGLAAAYFVVPGLADLVVDLSI